MVNKVAALRAEIEERLTNGDFKGDTGETTLPVARASSSDGIAYDATDAGSGCTLPTVSVADNWSQISAVGKGRQIVFIPYEQNLTNAPTLRINGGEVIPIRLRAPKNQGGSDYVPDATLPVPVGALMRGVPYTLTFCGKYWLVDSQIAQYVAPVELTWNQDTYTNVLDFLRTIESPGRYTFADDYGKYFYILTRAYCRAYCDGLWAWYGILVIFSGEENYIETTVYTGSDVGVLSPDNYFTPITSGALDYRVPKTTAADAGKVLTVGASGRPAWTSVTNAEEVAV